VGRLTGLPARVVRVLGEAQLLERRHGLELERTAGGQVGDFRRAEACAVDLVGHRDLLEVVAGQRGVHEGDVALEDRLEVPHHLGIGHALDVGDVLEAGLDDADVLLVEDPLP
jgi:hypothetical protein